MASFSSEVEEALAARVAVRGAPTIASGRPSALKQLYTHVPHPHIAHRKKNAPRVAQEPMQPGPIERFNTFLALKITQAVGTMWCAYIFAAIALISLPDAIHNGTSALVAWLAQTFLQLVLLSIIIVGQKVEGASSEKRAIETYNDAEAILHESVEIQKHLAEQDRFLQRLIDELVDSRSSPASSMQSSSERDPGHSR